MGQDNLHIDQIEDILYFFNAAVLFVNFVSRSLLSFYLCRVILL